MDPSVRTRRLAALDVLAGAALVGLSDGVTAAVGGRLGLGVVGFGGVIAASLVAALLMASPVALAGSLIGGLRRQPVARRVLAGMVPAGGAWLAVAWWPGLGPVGWLIGVGILALVATTLSMVAARSPLGERAALALAVLGLWLPTLLVRSPGPTARVSGMERPNVLLVTVSGLRADRVGAHRVDTSAFDRVAGEGSRLEMAVSPSPDTRVAAQALLTGIAPWEAHREDAPTLAGVLRSRGYATGAFVGTRALARGEGLDDGFGVYDDEQGWPMGVGDSLGGRMVREAGLWARPDSRRAGDVIARAGRFVRGQAGVWFAWVHLDDPETPFDPPTPWDERYYEGQDPRSPGLPPLDAAGLHPETAASLEGVRDPAYLAARYDGEVAYADAEIARLLSELDDAHLSARTLVVITGLTGMVLDEREPRFGRVDDLSPEVVDVPAALRWPARIPVGQRVLQPVSLTDLGATILDSLDPERDAGLGGVSIRPTAMGTGVARSVALSMSADGSAVGARVPGALLVLSNDGETLAWRVAGDPDAGEPWSKARIAGLLETATEALGEVPPAREGAVDTLLEVLQPRPATPLEPRFEP